MDSQSLADNRITAGQLDDPARTQGDFNVLSFIVQQAMAKVQTATLVRIVAVNNTGALEPVGLVDVEPLVNQIDRQGIPTEHATIFNVPYVRIQGGANAIIIDPEVGDIGMCVFASRDISKVKATKDRANPGSFRQYNFADGMYLGGLLNGTPAQYIQFDATGIKIFSPVKTTVQAPTVNVIAASVANVTAPAINLGASGQTLLALVTSTFTALFNSHTHTNGAGTTGGPNSTMGAGHMTTTVKGG
jgi:hypothetical protein